MNCLYEKTPDEKLWKCQRQKCGHELLVRPHHKSVPNRVCGVTSVTQCVHRGSLVGEQECETCQGSTRIKLFACALHGVCTIGKRIDMLACCAQCGDYEAARRDTADDGRAG